jgi:hypothetical protein
MTTSVLNKKQLTVLKPDENLMFDREGFDRAGIRREYAPINALSPGQRYIEQGDATFMSPDSDFPEAPTSVGESFGNVTLERVTGKVEEIPRYTGGFHLDVEDQDVDMSHVTNMRDGIMELFDIQADYAFLQGLSREDGSTVFKGVFQWLQDEMPTSNIIDCSNYDPSSGDLQGVPANIITQIAFDKVSGEYVGNENMSWDLAVAKPEVWAYWNQYGTFDGAVVQSQWELVDAAENDMQIGVRRRNNVPREIGLRGPPDRSDLQLSVDMPSRANSGYSSPLSDAKDDVMFLIPQHNGDFYELWEEGSPDHRVIEKEGWKERHEYKWRAGVTQGMTHKRSGKIAVDAIKLENVTALFD